jgi:dihydroflavonol-4-reductase
MAAPGRPEAGGPGPGVRAFVTGGSGFLGGALVRRLVTQGREVAALGRSDGARAAVEAAGARPVPGDLLDATALAAGMRGCDVVFHVGGINALCVRDRPLLFEVNVAGSRNVIEAAAAAGVGRVVYTSSAATLGERAGTIGSEDSEHRGFFLSSYERSKFEAERLVIESAASRDLEVVSVNPASVQGPGRAGGTALILRAYLNRKLKLFVDTRISLVDIEDCIEGHLLAEAKGSPGRRYLLSGHTLTSSQALEAMARVSGTSYRPVFLPGGVATVAAAAAEGLARLRGRPASICPEMVRTLLFGHAYDGSRAKRELGLSYRPVEETLARAVEWLAAQGLVPRAVPRG